MSEIAETIMSDKEEILKNNLDHTIFSWTKQGGLNPMNIERGEGVYLYDRDGKKWLDFSSQLMNVNIGHGRKEVRDAVLKQMNEVSYVYPELHHDFLLQTTFHTCQIHSSLHHR